jgi:hypothetical protein
MRTDAQANQFSLVQMQQGKAAAESELQTFKATLQDVRNEHSRDRSLLETVKREVSRSLLSCCLLSNTSFAA